MEVCTINIKSFRASLRNFKVREALDAVEDPSVHTFQIGHFTVKLTTVFIGAHGNWDKDLAEKLRSK